jgi:copper(I)-binding protein
MGHDRAMRKVKNLVPTDGDMVRLAVKWACIWGAGLSALGVSGGALAAGLSVQGAWAPPSEAGADIGLYMTIRNDDNEADALVRATCPFANFSERRTVDVGEGGVADRAIPNIPVAAHAVLELGPKTYHVGLLQTRDKLTAGDTLTCNVTFRRAGPIEVKVIVSPSPP